MINELLLFSDSFPLVKNVRKILEHYAKLPTIQFKIIDQIENIDLNSNQALILLSTAERQSQTFLKEIDNSSVAYIASKPDHEILESLSNYKLIGIQRHLYRYSEDALNLGAIRSNIAICEPTIRESTLTLLDLNVVRKSELLGANFAFPSGLFTEDVSQMCRYAGMSENVKSLVIHNAQIELVDLLAQLIWYFAEAAALRFPDHPYFTNTVEEYAVEVSSFDTVLSFFKSKSSGRWWVKIPDIQENKWKSCTYEDYQQACNDNISSELLEIIAIA